MSDQRKQKKIRDIPDFIKTGGAERDRTADLCIANAALSQLSYGPIRRRILSPVVMAGKTKYCMSVPAD